MRWFIALLLLAFLGSAIWFIFLADREFQSYSGAEIGMQSDEALGKLTTEGWVLIESGGCPGTLALIEAKSPDYALLVKLDQTCKVEGIERKLRKIEL